MLTSILFQGLLGDGCAIGDIAVDACVSEVHEQEATVTTSPIEDGSEIADHVIVQPARITIEGVITETPLGFKSLLASGVNAGVSSALAANASGLQSAFGGAAGTAASVLTVAGGSLAGLINSGADKEDAFEHLSQILQGRKLVSVVTGLKTYENMVMTSLNCPRDSKTGGALRFTAAFTEVRFVSASLAEMALGALEGALPGVSKGAQSATDVSGGAGGGGSSNKTLLKSGFDKFKAGWGA